MGDAEKNTVHSTLVTLSSMISLLTLCPPFVILLWYTMVHADGSVALTWEYFKQHGLQGFKDIWPTPSLIAWKIIFVYGIFEAALQLLLPGKRVEGPISPNGNTPIYKANGLQAYAVTLITYLSLWCDMAAHVAPNWAARQGGAVGSGSGWRPAVVTGMELYPRIGKSFDIKVFTNCRFGLMSWAVLAVTYCIKQYEENGRVANSMLINTILMLVYVSKFFWWESGYWCTMDIAHDRAGFYICWGCLVWVPSIYTSPGMYLVNHPINLGSSLAISILLSGLLCIYINYDCDRQRQEFRRTNGKCLIWGRAPSKVFIMWGLSRHFHYVPEIMAAFFWTVPALFNHCLPYFYVVFLTILLFDRAKRDDDRCSSKYGKYWKLYCQKVPYKIIPGIY
ncbi:hypothetical protein Taro_012107 [Colocasia esculenta]|uniref:7-dehydrocholesterol reductase n=1 Tax=Colocasia esculenta TaxID=4460 RepID=A0A843UCQ1_COLES|nr:hypothetical protein [Colocasia esculenta]